MTASRRIFQPITADVAACADWAVRTLAAAAAAEVGLSEEAVQLDQLPELTVEMFTWPGLLERAGQVLTDAGLAVLAMFLTERRAHPWPLAATEQVMLIAGVGPAAADLLDDTRIAAGPYQVVQHAYRIIALVSELLHHRHGPKAAHCNGCGTWPRPACWNCRTTSPTNR